MVLYLQEILSELGYIRYFENTVGSIELTSDSRSTFSLVTSTKVLSEILNKVDVAGKREAFNVGKLVLRNYLAAYKLTNDS